MKQGRTLSQMAAELERQQETKRDFIADTREIDFNVTDGGSVLAMASHQEYPLTESAARQIGDRVGIPTKYFRRMQEEAPELLAENVNHWFHNKPERRMVRTLDGNARAFLSDSYHRIDNYDVANMVLPVLGEIPDLKVASVEVTENRLYLKAVSPRIAGEVKVGDPVEAGVMITNSEIGKGSLSVSPFVNRLVCLNGMVLPDGKFRKNHVGARADATDALYELLSDETKEADDRAILLKVRDVVRASMDQVFFDKQIDRMREAAGDKIEGNPAAAVEVLTSNFTLSQEEGGGVLRHLIEGGDLSRWGVLNAVTRTSQDIESYDRATEFEVIGGKILDLAPSEWREVSLAA